MASDTRSRMIDAAVTALRRHGIAGMSFTEVLDDSGAARGAIYHHFPGGKNELVAEAAARNGADVHAAFAALRGGSPRSVVDAFLATVRPVIEESTTGCGCAVAAVAVGRDGGTGQLRQVAASVFAMWEEALANRLVTAGMDTADAAALATTLVALLQGAQVLCRAAGNIEPFERIVRTVDRLVSAHP
jgi:TetR/AcrR family transcriptional regulator, lmrAB and yxaGH operons repressor